MNKGIVSIEKAILCDICLGIPMGWIWSAMPEVETYGAQHAGPVTFLFRGEQLGLLKSLHESGHHGAVEAVRAIIGAANEVLKRPLYSVVDKPRPAQSGDPHDYQSFGKYWWPNPGTETGLPWVRRDGEVNPQCYGQESDYPRLVHFSETIVLLALAAYLSDEARYRERAVAQLRTWFLDEATRQNPNFGFAQQIPGREEDRRAALIEARHLLYVTEAIRILEYIGALSGQDSAALRAWYGDLLQWIRESAQGRRADVADNNIALWHDLQCMVYGKFCGDGLLVEEIVRKSLLPRLARQIAPDGSLPQEMVRARSYDYVAFSIAAMALLSRVAEAVDVPLWDIETGDGRNYQAAHDWLLNMTAAERHHVTPLATILGHDAESADQLQRIVDLGLMLRGTAQMSKEREKLLEQADRQVAELTQDAESARAELAKSNERLRELEARNEELQSGFAALRDKTGEAIDLLVRERSRLNAYADEVESRYLDVLASRTWRMMEPVRAMIRLVRGIARGGSSRRDALPERLLPEREPAERILSEVAGRKIVLAGLRKTESVAKPAEAERKTAFRPSTYLRLEADATSVRAGEGADVHAATEDLSFEIHCQLESGRAVDERALAQAYRDSVLSRMPDTFALYRIIGNDLYPRHARGQSRENVRFILDNEPALPDCEKRWIVNRIVDVAEERAIIDLLESRGQHYLRIPFDYDEYAKAGWDMSVLPCLDFLGSEEFNRLGPEQANRLITALYRFKNNYVMNNNGARNAALRDGLARAKWVLPWDGNCFVTAKAWSALREGISARPFLKYFVVPMQRITDNGALLRDDFAPWPVEEPQLVFRCDARESFNESFCYGRRPKVELFWRLGIPGKWHRWKDDPWDQERRPLSDEAYHFGAAGWVARMFSGVVSLEQETKASFKNRGIVRQSAIISTIDWLDGRFARCGSDRLGLTCYSMESLEKARAALREGGDDALAGLARSILEDADEALSRGPYSVTHKTTLAPSGDPRDYWHPAPYWWPNSDMPEGLPYVKRDGERVPGTNMYEPESDKYDRTRLQRLFDDTTALALAWYLTGRREYAEHAARNVTCWFVDAGTRMNPHLRFSQVRMGHRGNEGVGAGTIEFKDLYYFLDAVRILEVAGALDTISVERFRDWLREYTAWLDDSEQGRKECSAANNHGTYYDLQTAAIAAYLGDGEQVRAILERALARMPGQFAQDGSQPEELARRTTAHYCCFNLQGWLSLALLANRYGVNLWSQGGEETALGRGVRWLLDLAGKPWPYEQILAFDERRFDPLAVCAALRGEGANDSERLRELRMASPLRFDPHDGIPPYWNIAWPLMARRHGIYRVAASAADPGDRAREMRERDSREQGSASLSTATSA